MRPGIAGRPTVSVTRASRWRRGVLALAALGLLALPHCAASWDSSSKVNALRVLGVSADRPYALPGEEVTLRMTVHDGLGDPADPASGPRSVQILWLAGCFDPVGDLYYLCYEDLAAVLAPLAGGAAEGGMSAASGLLQIDLALPQSSGVPDAHAFTFTLPDDIITRRPAPEDSPHYGIAYVFFAACAGTLALADIQPAEGAIPSFPVQCLDDGGTPLGPDSFVPGYTQVYAFADGRGNANPPVDGLALDAVPVAEDFAQIPVVPACPLTDDERRQPGCWGTAAYEGCQAHRLEALVGAVAEVDPDGTTGTGAPLREAVWVSYYADRGDIAQDMALVSDSVTGYRAEHATEWVAPAQAGPATLWAVVRDQRGGSTVVRRLVRVE
ncbi:MAG: hypothetical protein HY744_18625 [Deltaproteobacteria bacterium]|nr:hypothetical protein [Deltaproteobacteria bacterium]